jgi:DNA-binding NarL/FixJ family response regulator
MTTTLTQTAPAAESTEEPIRVLLVDDHWPTRESVARLINDETDMQVVADVATGEDTMVAARLFQPGVAVLDILLPGMTGIEVCRQMAKDMPATKLVALSNHAGTRLVKAFMEAGGTAYVRKDRAFEELVPAIRCALSGATYFGQDVMNP